MRSNERHLPVGLLWLAGALMLLLLAGLIMFSVWALLQGKVLVFSISMALVWLTLGVGDLVKRRTNASPPNRFATAG